MKNYSLNHTDKATLSGLYLAKYDKKAIVALGCTGVWQAFNIIGYSLESGPASIKNYRDEFDHEIRKTNPLHPREGWKRPLKKRSQRLYELFSNLDFVAFTDLIKSFLVPTLKKEELIAPVTKQEIDRNIAQRLMTGSAAESYFKLNHTRISVFEDYSVEDVTSCGCGYDFHLSKNKEFFCVEIKGLAANTGTILMTQKEHAIANKVREHYCLFIVRNFQKTPCHSMFFNPLFSELTFTQQPKTIIEYTTYLSNEK